MTPIISFRSVTKLFPGVIALADVSFELVPGECHAICGENGAGKSTLMKLLSGVITDYEGEITVRGAPVRFRGTRDAEAAGIAPGNLSYHFGTPHHGVGAVFTSDKVTDLQSHLTTRPSHHPSRCNARFHHEPSSLNRW